MGANRHLSRIIALQTLFEWDFRAEKDYQLILKRNLKEFEKSIEDPTFAQDIVDGVVKHHKEIDDMIMPVAPEWPLEQIPVVDKTILRLAIYELLFKREVPPKVAINEAVELAKAFGGENASKFINGVLGTIYRSSDRYIPEEDTKMLEAQEDHEHPELKAESKESFEELEEKELGETEGNV